MTRYSAFISLGPSCLSASLLRNLDLRNCSFPFDWGQTGGLHLHDALELEPDEFYKRHIEIPNIQLTQVCDPEMTKNNTSLLKQKEHIYGFPYYHNPHRPLGRDRDYYIRCLLRFKDTIDNDEVKKYFLLSDYLDRPGENYYEDPGSVGSYIEDILSKHIKKERFHVVLVRLNFENILFAQNKVHQLSKNCKLCYITIPKLLSDSGWEKIASKLSLQEYANDKDPLYTPNILDNP